MVDNSVMNANALYALGAAFLFGASTPLAKHLSGDMPSLLLAGLLYLGSGLGLTLAQTFVQQHHGMIECDSEPGRTDFKILIPLP